ncbi:MAG: carboxypeptidase-like regulatory domain-containing protein, partial [Candidatus Korobacteraceae bacterium]
MKRSIAPALHELLRLPLLATVIILLAAAVAWAQGETTSAILGQVTDSTNAALPGATVTAINRDTGLKRTGKTDDAGRFNFPQLPPGDYLVRAEAQGFEPSQASNVIAGLGQKQTVNLTLKVAQAKQSVDVTAEAAVINTDNANTTTTLSAPALENLPNPGGDLTYPLQFAPGALINT